MTNEATREDTGERRVGIFGGSFNPPHVGHVLAATYALLVCPIDEILIVPVYQHPFAKALASFDHRLAMCGLAFADLPRARVSAVERELGGESLTLHTLERLAEQHPSWRMRLVLGSDVLNDVHKWHRFDRVSELAPPFFIKRAGGRSAAEQDGEPGVLPEVSSTQVRSLFASKNLAALDSLVPQTVLSYAKANALYGLE